jgi:hypothetical protein
MCRGWPRTGPFWFGNLFSDARRHDRSHPLTELHECTEQGTVGDNNNQCTPNQALQQTPPDLLFNDLATNVGKPSIIDTRRTGGLTGATGEAAVQMRLNLSVARSPSRTRLI